MKNLNRLHKRSVEFNIRCGNNEAYSSDSEEFWTKLSDQVARLKEEVLELEEATNNKALLGVLDGTVDVAVVNSGIIHLLEGANVDVDEAMDLVAVNNNSKFTKNRSKAEIWQRYHQSMGTECYLKETNVGGLVYFAVRRSSDNKILKPKRFKAVDLKPCLPFPKLETTNGSV